MGTNGRDVNWLDLPDHILPLIADALIPQKDLIRFGAVCHSWQSAYTDTLRRRSPRLPLLILAMELNHDDQTRSFYSLTDKRVCNSQVPVPHNRFCSGSSHGWLITVSPNFEVRLLNPFLSSDNEINLPALSTFEYCQTPSNVGYLKKAVLSANPTLEPNYVVMVIYSEYSRLAYCKPGDKSWTSVRYGYGGGRRIADVVYYRDQFYVVNYDGEVFACDFNHPDVKVSRIAPRTEKCSTRRYLVESSGELLQILRFTKFTELGNNDNVYNYFTGGFDVFKLDQVELKWIELDNLDGRILFLGNNCSMCLKASDFPQCKANSIYFTDDYYKGYSSKAEYGIGPHDMGVFSLEDGSVEPHYPTESNMIYPAPIWIEPPL